MLVFGYRFICLSPSLAFEYLKKKAGSIIFTSGTLKPFEGYETIGSVNVPFPIRYSCGHVIDSRKQLSINIVPRLKFIDTATNYTYSNRNNEKLKHHTGVFLGQLSKIVPQGMVVFFPSYFLMNQLIKKWKTHANGVIWKILSSQKFIAIESKDKKQFQSDWNKFSEVCKGKIRYNDNGTICNSPSNGGIFFAVAGAKLSEGIDFTDGMARLVVIVGIPYKSNRSLQVN